MDVTVIGTPPDEPRIDTAVLDVAGGHLSWSVLALDDPPASMLDDVVRAQEWLWAVYGEGAAVAIAEGRPVVPSAPALPELVADARRLAYALWAQRWWPASRIDAIAPLDERILAEEIAALAERVDLVIDPEMFEAQPRGAELRSRASDYALAAGAATGVEPSALVLSRGTAGSDWRRCPPGLVDASERAVSWEIVRTAGVNSVILNVAAAPGLQGPVPDHLRPRALVAGVAVELSLVADEWLGVASLPSGTEPELDVEVEVPHFGTSERGAVGEPELRKRVRDFARGRLRAAADPTTSGESLLAEIDAARSETDF